MLYPPETRALLMLAIERFNAKNLPLSNGSVARLTGSSFDDYASTNKIGSPSNQASLWIAPITSLASEESEQTDRTIGGCVSLMSTRLGVAARPIDTFTLPVDRTKLSLLSLLGPKDSEVRSQPAIVLGTPRFSSSGLLAALGTTAEIAGSQLTQLSPQSISVHTTPLKNAQERVRNYVVDDADALDWLAARQGGDPILAVTTEQAIQAFKNFHPAALLEWVPFTSPAASLDYPLCDITYKNDSQLDLEAMKLARSFFSSDEFRALSTHAGFSAPTTGSHDSKETTKGAIRRLLQDWPQIRRPAVTIFVVDTSVKTDRSVIETIRREISLFVDTRPSTADMVALISASSNPEVMRDPTTDTENLQLSISRLTTAGGNAIRDGIDTALSIFDGNYSTSHRRSIIVFTSANDTSSQTTVERLTNRASQLVGRKNVNLFVIATGGSEQDFGDLPALTRKVGGHFVLTDIASLPASFYPIARQVQ
jgi:Mg-chelatase subunit ChlD